MHGIHYLFYLLPIQSIFLFLTFFICFLCFDFPRRKFVSYCFDEDIVSFLYGSPLRQIKNRLKVGVRSSRLFCYFIGFQCYFLFKVDLIKTGNSPSYHFNNNLTIIPAYIELAIFIKTIISGNVNKLCQVIFLFSKNINASSTFE